MCFSDITLGTTLIAFLNQDNIFIATDSHTSVNNLISNRVSDKISILNNHIVCCRSGTTADTQFIIDNLNIFLKRLANETKKEINVRSVVQILREMCYQDDKESNYGFIIAGWDSVHGCQIYIINQGGSVLRKSLLLAGSGSFLINSFCESNYNKKMNYFRSKEFILQAISIAMIYDTNTGGAIRFCCINKKGIKKETIIPNINIKRNIFTKKGLDFLI